MKEIHIRENHFLKPAHLYFTAGSMVITTILGSCLTMTMFSRRTGVAAACHAVLPACNEKSCPAGRCRDIGRYVACVIPEMLRRYGKLGVEPGELEIKMFGGADMIMVKKESWTGENERVGRKNILMARELIQKNRLKLKNADVGGTLGRKLFFDTDTGEVLLKRLSGIEKNKEVKGRKNTITERFV